MVTTKRTDSGDKDFRELVRQLDIDLAIRDGADHSFFAQFNKIDMIKHVVVAYDATEPVGCGAVKPFSEDTMEVKRMYVPPNRRGRGIASIVLKELETWCLDMGYMKCVLETGKKQPEAIELYKKNNYRIILNFGQYKNVENSVCFEKSLAR
jgi:GNAT superfamily N-acetyltransferase